LLSGLCWRADDPLLFSLRAQGASEGCPGRVLLRPELHVRALCPHGGARRAEGAAGGGGGKQRLFFLRDVDSLATIRTSSAACMSSSPSVPISPSPPPSPSQTFSHSVPISPSSPPGVSASPPPTPSYAPSKSVVSQGPRGGRFTADMLSVARLLRFRLTDPTLRPEHICGLSGSRGGGSSRGLNAGGCGMRKVQQGAQRWRLLCKKEGLNAGGS